MKTQDKSFHKTWHKNLKKYENKHINKTNVYKTVLKIVLLLLIIFTLLIVYRWTQKIPDVELLDINTEQILYKPDTLYNPKLLIKNKYDEPIIIEAFQAEIDDDNSNILILEKH
ncbi:MAG: hypothetical protein H8E55_67505 [Pelagibacterales bacterium]|nr:hypothetical protein [Pelagibacterales bacterium]